MKTDNKSRIIILKEMAYFLDKGEDLNILDILSVFNVTVSYLIKFLEKHNNAFSEYEYNLLGNFFIKNLDIESVCKNKKKAKKENLTEIYKVMDLETGEITLETTPEDAAFVYDELKKNGVTKIYSELIYIGLKRYATKGENVDLFEFRKHIENIFAKSKKKR